MIGVVVATFFGFERDHEKETVAEKWKHTAEMADERLGSRK